MGLNQNIKAGKAAADNFPGRCDRSGIQAVSIPPRPDGRYPDWVAIDRSWPPAVCHEWAGDEVVEGH
ncbi:MAG TPA: hypothetical protein PKM59_16975, partial [Thermodesulfobacteriota bacterium]|nr:hypothetical protein [Thermodesulfobacteriota bacterium]